MQTFSEVCTLFVSIGERIVRRLILAYHQARQHLLLSSSLLSPTNMPFSPLLLHHSKTFSLSFSYPYPSEAPCRSRLQVSAVTTYNSQRMQLITLSGDALVPPTAIIQCSQKLPSKHPKSHDKNTGKIITEKPQKIPTFTSTPYPPTTPFHPSPHKNGK